MTRIAIISDLHSNIEALTRVLKDAKQKECTQIRCLGDLVDYGPDPRKVVETIMKRKIHCAMGNHEQMVLGERYVHERIRSTVGYSRKKLTKKQLAFLRTLPTTIEEDDILYVHAAPVQGKSRELHLRTGTLENKPELATYLLVSEDYDQVKNLLPIMFDNFKKICFVGHTHMPILAGLTKRTVTHYDEYRTGSPVKLKTGKKYIINPGSVGQPRAGDPRANYATFDTETRIVQLQFVEYDIRETMRKITEADLPFEHAIRLTLGR